ncbi:MAG: SAF domain-containing protein [Eubacteriales bacterium]
MRFRRIVKPLTGVMLIVISIGVLFWWEHAGREAFFMKERLVLAKPVNVGVVVSQADFKSVRINDEAIQKGSITESKIDQVLGKVAKRDMRKGEQVNLNDFVKKDMLACKGISIYAIKSEWLDSRSCSLRKGDTVRIYDASGEIDMGSYKLAYVKSETEQEVVNGEGTKGNEIVERDFASSPIAFIEIFCRLEDYRKIYEMAENSGEKLLIVQEV